MMTEYTEFIVLASIISIGVCLIGIFTYIVITQFKDFKELDK